MIHGPAHPAAHHSIRYYLVIGTLVIAGIFLLLQINGGDGSLTGSVVGVEGDSSDIFSAISDDIRSNTGNSKGNSASSKASNLLDDLSVISYDFSLSLDNIPKINQEEIETEEIVVIFTDLSTRIKVDQEELTINGLESVTLTINQFEGGMIIDENGLSINGNGKELIVNGVTLSTKNTLKIAFDFLNFESIEINDVSMKKLSFDKGDGDIILKDKLDYDLDDESVLINGFKGDVTFDHDKGTSYLGGKVNSFSIDGLLELQVN